MDPDLIRVAAGSIAAIVTAIQLLKRTVLGGAEAMDELSRRRPLKRHRELLEAARPDSPMAELLELERDSELFRQVFGKALSGDIEQLVIALRTSGHFSTRELRYVVRFMAFDANVPADAASRALAVWSARAGGLQSVLVGVVVAMATLGAIMTPLAAAMRFFLPVLVVSVPGFFYFVYEAIQGHLARKTIDRVQRYRECERERRTDGPDRDPAAIA